MALRIEDMDFCNVPPSAMKLDWPAIADALSIRWYEGAVTPIRHPLESGWRTFPYALLMHLRGGTGLIRFADRPDQVVSDGSTAFVAPRIRHFVELPVRTVSWWAHFEISLYGIIDVFTLVQVPEEFHGSLARRLGALCHSIAHSREGLDSFGSALHYQSLCHQFASTLLQVASPNPDAFHQWSSLERIRPVLHYMRDHLADPVDRDILARKLNVSPQWFHTVFSQVMGEPPMAYLNRLRIAKASRLLIATTHSVSEISQMTGFSDPLYFSRLFKKKTGSSPLAYRRSSSSSLHFG